MTRNTREKRDDAANSNQIMDERGGRGESQSCARDVDDVPVWCDSGNRDGDGWWEYIPEGTTPFETPPYVYFDASSYNLRPTYPNDAAELAGELGEPAPSKQNDIVPGSGPGGLVQDWGVAVPYARQATNGSPNPQNAKIEWLGAGKFQIICGGSDGSYGRDANLASSAFPAFDVRQIAFAGIPFPEHWPPVPTLQSAQTPDVSTGFQIGHYPGDRDNLTNFYSGTLQDLVEENTKE